MNNKSKTKLNYLISSIQTICTMTLFSAVNGYASENLHGDDKLIERPLPLFAGLQWRKITAGSFLMGSDYASKKACKDGLPPENSNVRDSDVKAYCRENGPSLWFDDEKPIHEVKIPYDFWMSDSEVTVAQFRVFTNETGYLTVAERTGRSLGESVSTDELENYAEAQATWRKPWGGAEALNNHPVVHVAWEDAVAFCDWLSAKSGLTIRLPTETEWEYAAQAGAYGGNPDLSIGEYSWGAQFYPDSNPVGNFADREFGDLYPHWKYPVAKEHSDGYARLAPVRSFNPNSFGLYDMSGNVWEWTASVYRSRAYDEPLPASPLDKNPSKGFNHTLRGGSFDFELPFLRTEKRRSLGFVRQSYNINSSISIGFRILSGGPVLGTPDGFELTGYPGDPSSGKIETIRPAGGKWIAEYDEGKTKITFVGTQKQIVLERDLPEDFNPDGETELRILSRIYDARFGYFPKVMPTPSGRNAWIWDTFHGELIKISDSKVLASINIMPLALYGISEVRVRGEDKVALMLEIYAVDDYGDERIATVVLGNDNDPKVKIIDEAWWHGKGPDLQSLTVNYLWGDN